MFHKKHNPFQGRPITDQKHPFIKKSKTFFAYSPYPSPIDNGFIKSAKIQYPLNYN